MFGVAEYVYLLEMLVQRWGSADGRTVCEKALHTLSRERKVLMMMI